jgi:hypothetical protein
MIAPPAWRSSSGSAALVRKRLAALLADLSHEEAALVERVLDLLHRAAERRLSQGVTTS